MGAIIKFNNGSGPNADLACECTQTYHGIKQIFYVMSIILVVQLVNQGHLNLQLNNLARFLMLRLNAHRFSIP